jgi:hypothetical protein
MMKPLESAIPSSLYSNLQDLSSPSGKLSVRIERLRQRCIEALGREAFLDAYCFLKQHEEVRENDREKERPFINAFVCMSAWLHS